MELSDEAAVERCLKGDRDAFSLLVEKYQNAVYGLCYHIVGDFTDAQDLTQEAFVRAYLDLAKIRDLSKFASWLYRLTVNVCRMWLRQRKREDNLSVEAFARTGELPGEGESPAEHAENEELRLSIAKAIGSLSEKNRLAATLYYIDGLSHKEIGNFLDLSSSAVKSRLHRARKQLREELISMIEEEFGKHKLPGDFSEKVVQEVEVKSVLVEEIAGEYCGLAALVLQSKADEKQLLVIFDSLREGYRVAQELRRIELARRVTKGPSLGSRMLGLMARVLEEFGMEVVRVVVTDLKREILDARKAIQARITIQSDGILKEIDCKEIGCRPSHAIALALRTGAPIFVAKSVLSKHSVEEVPWDTKFADQDATYVLLEPEGVTLTFHRVSEEKQPPAKLVELSVYGVLEDFRLRKTEYENYEKFRTTVEYEGFRLLPLLKIDPKFQGDLDSGNFPEELRRELESNNVLLSHNISSRGISSFTPLLFSVDLKFKTDLDNCDIPEELRQEFGENGFPLSNNIRFVAQRQKGEWLIEDGEKPYRIKESAYSLHVYTLQHKEWSIRDEDNGREYFVTKVVDGLDFYSIPAH